MFLAKARRSISNSSGTLGKFLWWWCMAMGAAMALCGGYILESGE